MAQVCLSNFLIMWIMMMGMMLMMIIYVSISHYCLSPATTTSEKEVI